MNVEIVGLMLTSTNYEYVQRYAALRNLSMEEAINDILNSAVNVSNWLEAILSERFLERK